MNYLIEDYADEWLTKAMFHYRWHYQADIDMAGKITTRWSNIQAPEVQLQKLQQFVCERQTSRLYVVGSNDVTAPVIEASYKRFLSLMDTVIEKQMFLFGARPSSADFSLYAQSTQLAKCLEWVNLEYQKLDETSKTIVDQVLSGTGCEQILLNQSGH
jgi:glutathione S-transferase